MNIFTGINMMLYWLKESIGLAFYLSGIVFFVMYIKNNYKKNDGPREKIEESATKNKAE